MPRGPGRQLQLSEHLYREVRWLAAWTVTLADVPGSRYNRPETGGISEGSMPIHDWSKAPAGLFHHFHRRWAVSICDALNAGRMPKGYYAARVELSCNVGYLPEAVSGDDLDAHVNRRGRAGTFMFLKPRVHRSFWRSDVAWANRNLSSRS